LSFLRTKSSSRSIPRNELPLRSACLSTKVVQVDKTTKLTVNLGFLLLLVLIIGGVLVKGRLVKLLRRSLLPELGILIKADIGLGIELWLRSILIHIDCHIHTIEHVCLRSHRACGHELGSLLILLVLHRIVKTRVKTTILLLPISSKVKTI